MNPKKIAALCALLVILTLSGCSGQPEASGPTVAPTDGPAPTAEVAATLAPTSAPTPDPLPDPASFEYSQATNETLGVRFKYPSHWLLNPAKKTLRYEETTPDGTTPARIAITYTKISKKPDVKAMKSQMSRLLTLLEKQYDSVTPLEVTEKVHAMGTAGYLQTYTAQEGGRQITGYALLCYFSSGKRLYLIHFSAPTDRYEQLEGVWSQVLESIERIK